MDNDTTPKDRMCTATGNYAEGKGGLARFIVTYYANWILGFIIH